MSNTEEENSIPNVGSVALWGVLGAVLIGMAITIILATLVFFNHLSAIKPGKIPFDCSYCLGVYAESNDEQALIQCLEDLKK